MKRVSKRVQNLIVFTICINLIVFPSPQFPRHLYVVWSPRILMMLNPTPTDVEHPINTPPTYQMVCFVHVNFPDRWSQKNRQHMATIMKQMVHDLTRALDLEKQSSIC